MLCLQSMVVIKHFHPFNQKKGVIEDIERVYKPIDSRGMFIEGIGELFESSLKHLESPFIQEGEFLTIKIPDKLGNPNQRTQTFKFFDYIYVVKIKPQILICLPEYNLETV